MFNNPTVRLVLRAAAVGVASFCVSLSGTATWDANLLKSAAVAAVLACLEVLTPLNPTVGLGKHA